MHPKNHPPVLVPHEYVAEFERLTKAALMDLAWELVAVLGATSNRPDDIIAEIRKSAAYVVTYREQQL